MKHRHESFLGSAGLQRLLRPSTKPVLFSNSCLQGLNVSAGLLHFSFSLILQFNYTRIRLELTFLFQNGMLCSYNEIHPLHLPMG